MLTITGTMRVPEDRAEDMKIACATMARASRRETGCHIYAFWQNVEDPGEFRVYEEWRDLDCLKAHGASDHMAAYRAKLAEIGVTGRNVELFEAGPKTRL